MMNLPLVLVVISAASQPAGSGAPLPAAPAPPSPTPATPATPLSQPPTGATPQQQLSATTQAGLRLGQRSFAVHQTLRIHDELLIVRTPGAALAAIAEAEQGTFRAVLIDDGTIAAGENIIRFARAFKPAVIRFESATPPLPPAGERMTALRAAALFKEPAQGKPASAPGAGVVAVDPQEDSSIAGAALARARRAPLVAVNAPKPWDHILPEAAVKLSDEITDALRGYALNYDKLADDIDAVTIVAPFPSKVKFDDARHLPLTPGINPTFTCKPGEQLALTDLIGRAVKERTTTPATSPGAGGGTRAFASDRWAWTGLIAAPATEALYRVMCSVCLQADSVFGFDGYDDSAPFNQYSIAKALEVIGPVIRTINQSPGAVLIRSKPDGSASSWMATTGRGIGASLWMVNTSGNADFFELKPGRALAGDIPLLTKPATAHFVHSWSAQGPENWNTIAGRFFAHGGFAFIGSMHEPFLQAFVPQGLFAARMVSGMTIGTAARQEGSPPWRVNVLGDAMAMPLAPSPPRIPALAAKPTVTTLEDRTRTAVANKSPTEAAAVFLLRGEDGKAAAVVAAALDTAATARDGKAMQTKPALDRTTLGQATLAAFRSGDLPLVAKLATAYGATFSGNAPPSSSTPGEAEPLEALWMLALAVDGSTKASSLNEEVLTALTNLPRPGQDEIVVRDTRWLHNLLTTRRGSDAARRMVQDRVDRSGKNEGLKKSLSELLGNNPK